MTDFTPVGARARGLLSHLFARKELEALALNDAASLPRALSRAAKLGPIADNASPFALELAARRAVGRHVKTLERWEGSGPILEVFAAEQDRRSLRALLRGAVQAAPAEARLAGLVPTPTLPERVLSALAVQPTPDAVVGHLVAMNHQSAGPLSTLTSKRSQPDLLALDLALVQAFGRRARAAAQKGDQTLRTFVAHRIDVCNAQAAFALAASPNQVWLPDDGRPSLTRTPSGFRPLPEGEASGHASISTWFVPGGACLTLSAFGEVITARPPGGPGAALRRALASTPLAQLTSEAALDAARLERRGFALALEELRNAARLNPLGSGPALYFLMRLEGQVRDVKLLVWGASLGAPAEVVRPELVTPWT